MRTIVVLAILISSVCFATQENVIKGVERLQWGKGQDCTYIGSLTALAHYVGDKDVTYDFLMGASGHAFRVQKWAKGWCPSAGDSVCGFNCMDTAPKVLGYEFEWYGWYDGKPDEERFKAAGKPLMACIDKGNLAISQDMDYSVIAGYQDGGKKLLFRSYFDKGDEYTVGKYPWAIIPFKGKGERMDRKLAVLKSLDYALQIWETEKFGDYVSGKRAYSDWVGALVDEASFKKMSAEEFKGTAQANGFCYATLVDGRSAAARYLRLVNDDLGPDASSHLIAAADIYDQIAAKLRGAEVVYSWEVEERQWTPEMRRKQAVILKAAASMEKQAVEELREAKESAR